MRVYLWSVANPVIVVPAQTGIVYCNQTDGVATVHRELEGYLLPLPTLDVEVFDPDWWYQHHNHRMPGDETDWKGFCRRMESAIDALPSSGEIPRAVVVREHADNCEAWVHVSFEFADLGPEAEGVEWRAMTGVLTWENCD